MRPFFALVITAVASSRLAAQGVPASAASDSAQRQARRELLAADSLWSAAAARDDAREGFLSRLADDSWYLVPGQPLIRGRKHARELMSQDSAVARLSWRAARVVASRDGAFGATFGYVALTSRGGSVSRAKYIAVWRRGTAGWNVAAWLLTLAPPGDPAPAPTSLAAGVPWAGASEGAEVARAAVLRTDAEFAARSVSDGLAAAFGEYAAEDAAVLSSDPGITWGRAAIVESNSSVPRSVLLAWAPVDGAAAGSADLGFTVGQATIASMPAGAPMRIGYSKYLTIWARQPNGAWRYVVDGGNRTPAP